MHEHWGDWGLAYYLAVSGSGLLMTGVWETGIGRERIVKDGAWLVIATGVTVLGVRFLITAPLLPTSPSTLAFQMGYFFALVGGALLIGGLAKLQAGVTNITNFKHSLNLMLAWKVKSLTLILLGVLSISLALLLLYNDTVVSDIPCYNCGGGGVFPDTSTPLAYGILTTLGALALGAATFMLLTSHRNNRTTSPTDRKP